MKKEEITVTANRKYKDTIFRMIFKEKKELLSLYNAVNNSHYEKEEDLQIVTLENAVYMNIKNDLAFLIDFHLYLYEHQSTYNPNMPLRDLFYVASEYQKLIDDSSLYSTSIVKIPAPKFITFYNGIKHIPDTVHLKLSNSYYTRENEPDLELKVTMLNLNAGNHQKLLENCQTLKEYMMYVERVRKYAGQPDITLDEAVSRAVNECIKENILADFLRKNRAEAIHMSIFEYDEERELALLRKDEYNAGMEAGKEAGIRENTESIVLRMLSAGTYSLEEIAHISGMDIEEVKKIGNLYTI
ncbi:MAG: hypothetical protein HDR30_05595 [Lachnospiraceae bacterium]|nr:hypothetical protein [Lachnospiraceae bacterium]